MNHGQNYSRSLHVILRDHPSLRSGPPKALTPEEQVELEAFWDELSEDQQQQLWGLSADLYQLSDSEKPEPSIELDCPKELLVRRIAEAMQSNRWNEALQLLRMGPKELSADQVAVFRGRAWEGLGHDEVALLFFDYATQTNPDHPISAILAMHLLLRLNRVEEAVRRARAYISNDQSPPNLLFKSADVLLADALDFSEHVDAAKCEEIIHVLQLAIRREQERTGVIGLFTGRAYAQLGLCHQLLKEDRKALRAYNSAVELIPYDAEVRVARGLFHYQNNPESAAEDFERAIALGTELVWPYFYLAHQAVREGDYKRFAPLYVQAMVRANSKIILAKLLEWWAITLVQLHGPNQDSLEFLSKAVELNPADQIASHNLDALREYISHPETKSAHWKYEDFPASNESREFLAHGERPSLAA